MLEWKNIIQTKTKISVKVGNIVDDDDDDETEMSWYEGTPGGSWRDMGARRKIQTWIARRDFLKNETIVKMTTTMMMRKLVMMMAMKVGDIYEDKLGTADETCLDGLYTR